METMDSSNVESQLLDCQQIKSITESTEAKDTNDLREKMEKVDVKSSSSPTKFLAKSTMLLPSGVIRIKQLNDVRTGSKIRSSTATNSSGSATGNPRNKTALAPGHSLMDWIRLGSSGVDLTGVGGVPQIVTLAELAKHNNENDAWIAIRGIVYNVTSYTDFHPGGISELMRGVGKDATKLFENVHAWVNYQSILQKCVVGRLSRLSTGSAEIVTTERTNSSSSSDLLPNCTSKSNAINVIASNISSGSNVNVDWWQTTNTITLSYRVSRNRIAAGYRLKRLTDSELCLEISLDNDIVTYEIALTEAIKWPPKWKRSFEMTQIDFTFTKSSQGATWKTYGSYTLLHEPKDKQRSYRQYKVVGNTPLCKMVHLLVLRADDYLELIPLGRHVEVKMNVMGMEVSRMYTPVPSCLHPEDMASMYEPDCLCLMIKRYDDGALSPSIIALEPGQILTLSNSLGTFVVEAFDDYPVIHMLAAGTGLTAMLGIIQRALCRRNVTTINLVNFNKNEDNIFYSAQLERVCTESRLKVTHVLSQPEDSWTGRYGVVSVELLRELIGNVSSQACIFTCGPKLFMLSARESLQNLGWKMSQMHEFDD